MRKLNRMILSLFLLQMLTSCAERIVVQTRYVQPPSNLTEETQGPSKVPLTVGELKQSALDLRLALDKCNVDKKEISKYGLAFKSI